jgi:hypothetical protein
MRDPLEETMATTRRRPRIEWPSDDRYQPCRRCSRCVSGTGRRPDPDAADCWAEHLDRAVQPDRRPA